MDMQRTMTVKGVGKVIARPDLIVITMDLVSKDMEYDAAMEDAAIKHDQLKQALAKVGIDAQDLKTTDFSINTEYIHETDRNGNPRRIFDGYVAHHQLQLELFFDMKELSRVIDAITGSGVPVEFQIRFTIQNKQRLTQELLQDAVNNATNSARILANASGVVLRDIVSITYDWSQISPFSNTRYLTGQNVMLQKSMDIVPDDIEVSDYVTMVWEIA